MIDEKLLDKWVKTLCAANTATFLVDDANELIHLARLGLWAKKVAIPTLSQCVDDRHYHGSFPRHSKALEELPK